MPTEPGKSYFVIPCECGATVHSHERETRCERCGRLLAVEWSKPAPGPAVDHAEGELTP